MRPKRDWTAARQKVDTEGHCRVCRRPRGLEAAHIVGRESDYDPPLRGLQKWQGGVVAPDRVVPLCGPATDVTTCHGKQHAKRLDLLAYLNLLEQLQAVADAGGIAQAYTALVPSENPKRVRGYERLPLPGD